MEKGWYWRIGFIFLTIIVCLIFYFNSSNYNNANENIEGKEDYDLREEMKKEDFDMEAYNLRFIDSIDTYKDLCISLCDLYKYKSHLVLGSGIGGNSQTKNIVCDCIIDEDTILRIFYDFLNQQIYGNVTEEI